MLATVASVLATGALGFIGFVPIVGLAVLPLQLLAWLARGLLFQFLGLAAVGAYAGILRRPEVGARYCEECSAGGKSFAISNRLTSQDGFRIDHRAPVPGTCTFMNMTFDRFFSKAAEQMRESAIRKMGTLGSRVSRT